MVRYIAHIVFMERPLSSQTHFLSLSKALEVFDIRVSSSVSSLLLLLFEFRYLNLFTWISTWLSLYVLANVMKSQKGLVYNLDFLEVNFQPR